jgi:molybdate transport system substrate-binding protein
MVAISLLMVLVMSLGLAACTSSDKGKKTTNNDSQDKPKVEEPIELNVLAAASMTETLTSLGDKYQRENSNVKINFNFGSSGALQTQIEEGAPADIFISAGETQMDALEKKNLIVSDTRKDLLGNDVVLIVPQNSKLDIKTFKDVAKNYVKTVAVGGENVPVGQYTQQIFEYYKIWDKVKAKASLGEDVKQVLSWVESGDADCGIVYKTDAFTTDKVTVAAAALSETHKPVLYPEAVIAASGNQDAAKAFLAYLSGAEAKSIFEASGFNFL